VPETVCDSPQLQRMWTSTGNAGARSAQVLFDEIVAGHDRFFLLHFVLLLSYFVMPLDQFVAFAISLFGIMILLGQFHEEYDQ
jgi:hypothetical protein